jgi:4-carboxymuconolactone decarboxylase
MARITPIADKSEVAPEYQNVVEGVLKVFGQIRGPHSILLHSPALAQHVLGLGNYFRPNPVVKSPEKELAIITGVREREALYVWAAQVGAARRGGLSEEAIAVVKERRDPSALPADQAAIVTYVRQLFTKNRVDQKVFDALKDRYGVQWLIEMTAIVGYYGMLSGVVNAFEVSPPPDGDVLPV